MSPGEVASFIADQRVLTCATLGPRGWPHLMPLWFVLRECPAGSPPAGSDPPPGRSDTRPGGQPGQRIWAWTYAASQKVRNLERDPRATLLVESGEQYQELKGVTFECEVAIHRELETVAALGIEIFKSYAPPSEEAPAEELAALVERQAAKRVALEFAELRRASWDHGKLGGTY
jgi:hypothetical protein